MNRGAGDIRRQKEAGRATELHKVDKRRQRDRRQRDRRRRQKGDMWMQKKNNL